MALGNTKEAVDNFNEALKMPDLAKIFEQASAKANREQQESTNEVKEIPSVDAFSSAAADPESLLMNLSAILAKRLQAEYILLSKKIDSRGKPTQRDMLELENISAKLQELYSTMNNVLKEQEEENQRIIRNL
jgi:hypothetical protein